MPQVNVGRVQDVTAGAKVLDNPQWQNSVRNAMGATTKGQEAEQGRLDAQNAKAQEMQLEGYRAILKNPSNAQALAQMYGIDYTPDLQQVLQNPLVLENVVKAVEMGKAAGINNPEALQELMKDAAMIGAQGKPFNPISSMSRIQGMETQAPMTPYQQQSIDLQRDRLSADTDYRNRSLEARLNAPVDLWDNPALSPSLRLEGQALKNQGFTNNYGEPDPSVQQRFADWEKRAMLDIQSKRPGGGAALSAAPIPAQNAAPPTPMSNPAAPSSSAGGGSQDYSKYW